MWLLQSPYSRLGFWSPRAGAVAAVEPPASANAPFANAIVLNTSPRSVRACRVPSASACAVRGSKFRCHRAGDVDVGSLMISADLVGKNLPSGFCSVFWQGSNLESREGEA